MYTLYKLGTRVTCTLEGQGKNWKDRLTFLLWDNRFLKELKKQKERTVRRGSTEWIGTAWLNRNCFAVVSNKYICNGSDLGMHNMVGCVPQIILYNVALLGFQ